MSRKRSIKLPYHLLSTNVDWKSPVLEGCTAEQLQLVEEANLDPLFELINESQQTKQLALKIINQLHKAKDGELLLSEELLRESCNILLTTKNITVQMSMTHFLALLLTSKSNYEIIKLPHQNICNLLKTIDLQFSSLYLVTNLSLYEEEHAVIIKDYLPIIKSYNLSDIRIKRFYYSIISNLCSDEENILFLDKSIGGEKGVKEIFSSFEYGDNDLTAAALHLLANLVSSDEHKYNIIQYKEMKEIASLLHSTNINVITGAVTLIANLADHSENHQPLLNIPILEPLLHIGRKSKNPDIQFRVAFTLNNFAANEAVKGIISGVDAITPLKRMAKSRDPEVKKEATEALNELGYSTTSSSSHKRKSRRKSKKDLDLQKLKIIERERNANSPHHPPPHSSSSSLPPSSSSSSFYDPNHPPHLGGDDDNAGKEEGGEKEGRENEMSAKILNEKQILEFQIAEMKRGIEAARQERLALSHDKSTRQFLDDNLQKAKDALQAAHSQREIIEKETKSTYEREYRSVIDALIQSKREREQLERALRDAPDAMNYRTLQDFNSLRSIKLSEMNETIDDEKDIEEDYDEEDDIITEDDKREKAKIALVMVDLWEPAEDPSITEGALQKLNTLSLKERNRKLIRIAGAIPILIEILKDADPSIGLTPSQSLALAVLSILCRNVRNRDEVRRQDGLRHVFRIAKVKDEKDLTECLKCLRELCKNDSSRIIFRDGKLIEFIISHLEKEQSAMIQELLLDILTILNINDDKSQSITKAANGVNVVLKYCNSVHEDVKRKAIRAIGYIAQNNRKIQQTIRKSSKIIPEIVKYLDDQNDEMKRTACTAIACISENDYENQIAIRKCGAVNMLMKIIATDDIKEETLASAVHAIRNLAKMNLKVQSDFYDDNTVIPKLVRLLDSENMNIKINAVGAIMELSRENSTNSDIICSSGAPAKLIACLNTENVVIQYLAEGTIWCLAKKNAKRRHAFREAVPVLQELSRSDNPQIQKGALWALEVL